MYSKNYLSGGGIWHSINAWSVKVNSNCSSITFRAICPIPWAIPAGQNTEPCHLCRSICRAQSFIGKISTAGMNPYFILALSSLSSSKKTHASSISWLGSNFAGRSIQMSSGDPSCFSWGEFLSVSDQTMVPSLPRRRCASGCIGSEWRLCLLNPAARGRTVTSNHLTVNWGTNYLMERSLRRWPKPR